jgi:hypothetical protein
MNDLRSRSDTRRVTSDRGADRQTTRQHR